MSILGVKELISRLKAQKAANKAQKTGKDVLTYTVLGEELWQHEKLKIASVIGRQKD